MPAARLLPGLADLRRYERAWLRRDLLAGLTVAAYLIPQVMAYAGLAGLPPVVGLWASLAPLALYAVLGSSRLLSIGPESTTALMTATAVAPLAAGDPGRYAAISAGLAVVVGLLSLLAFVARLGFVADLLSRPILVGYLAGVAVTMIVGQLSKLTGVPVDGAGVPAELLSFLGHLGQVHLPTAVFSGVSLALLFLGQRYLPRFPTPLFVVLLATAVVAVFDLGRRGLSVVGAVPPGLPAPALPDLADLRNLVLPAVGILVVGYTDTVLTARAFADRSGRPIDANQELLALGAANVGAGLLRGFPISSSGSRTALALASGARSQVYSLVALAAVVTILLAADILYGVLLAIGLSVAEMLHRVARPHDGVLGLVPGLAGMHDVDDYPHATTVPGLVVYRYDSPLFFANAENFHRRALAAVDGQPGPVRWFVLNAEANVEVDSTGLGALDQLRAELTGRGIVFALARVKQDLLDALSAYGLTASIGIERIYPTLPTAVAAYEKWRTGHDA